MCVHLANCIPLGNVGTKVTGYQSSDDVITHEAKTKEEWMS